MNIKQVKEALFRSHLRPRFADTDAQGVVYNGSFFQFVEVARFEMIEHAFSDAQRGLAFWNRLAVKEINITYNETLRFPERINVLSCFERIGKSSLRSIHTIRRAGEDGDVAVARLVAVYLDESGAKSETIPDKDRNLLLGLICPPDPSSDPAR
jgi:YbgC/YbaW family acyl-CoA thioester hydrolase